MSSPSENSTVAGSLMIASGALTVLASAGLFLAFIWVCVGAFWLLPMGVGLAEMVVGLAIMGGRPTHRVQMLSALGILSALACGNLIGVGLEVVSLVLVSKATPQLEQRY
jgi:hypothetical protein